MLVKPPLTPDFCVHAVVNATPSPGKYHPFTAATTTLFDLDVVDDVMEAHFVQTLQRLIRPWTVDASLITSTPDTTVQTAAASVVDNAT